MAGEVSPTVARKHLDRVRLCAAKSEEARDALRTAIIEAHRSGETYRDIATAAGVSYQRIGQIIKEKHP